MSNPKTEAIFQQWLELVNLISINLDNLSDEDLKSTILDGRSHGVWILGHLIEAEDRLSVFLGKGPTLFPEYEDIFATGKVPLPVALCPPIYELRNNWKQVIEKNKLIFLHFSDLEWDDFHAMYEAPSPPNMRREISDYFATKGRCLFMWVLHQSYHNGQLALLLAKFYKEQATNLL